MFFLHSVTKHWLHSTFQSAKISLLKKKTMQLYYALSQISKWLCHILFFSLHGCVSMCKYIIFGQTGYANIACFKQTNYNVKSNKCRAIATNKNMLLYLQMLCKIHLVNIWPHL